MLNAPVAIALVLCWIAGFFVLAQIIYHQSQIARKLDEIKNREQGSGTREQGIGIRE